jgi:hypothetical protein
MDQIVSDTDGVSLRPRERKFSNAERLERESSKKHERNVEIVIEEAIRNNEERDNLDSSVRDEENVSGTSPEIFI